jgi:hypothetical protein
MASQNWDGVSAGSIPSGWTVDSPATTTSTLSGGITPTSSPNVLEVAGAGANTTRFGTYGTLDGTSGNVTVSAYFAVTQFNHTSAGGVTARVSSSAPVLSSSTFYWAELDFFNGQLNLIKVVSGTQTSLGSVATSALAVDTWYLVSLQPNSSTISVSVQRRADGYYLNSSGNFQSTVATAISVSDSSISGQGYSGVTLAQKNGFIYTDDWSLATISVAASMAATERGDAFSGSSLDTHASSAITEQRDAFAGQSLDTHASASVTERHDTGSLAGRFTDSASMAKTESHDALAGSAGFKSPASMAKTESHDALAGSGSFATAAALGRSDGRDIFSGSSLDTHASASVHERHDVFAGSASGAPTGSMAVTERPDLFAGGGYVSPFMHARESYDLFAGSVLTSTEPPGSMAATESHDSFAGIGGFAFDSRSALRAFESRDVFAGIATQTSSGSIAAVERHDSFAGSSTFNAAASMSPTEAGDRFRGGYNIIEYHVYANTGAGDPINYDSPIDTTAGLTYTTSPLSYPGTWSFAVRAFNWWGEEKNVDCAVTIILDAMGQDISNEPLPPQSLRAFPTPGGGVRVEWYYPPTAGPKTPQGFHVYYGIGAVYYGTVQATVLYGSSVAANIFVANLSGLTNGLTYFIGVRAYNVVAEEPNTKHVSVIPVTSGPTAVSNLAVVATAQSA